MPSRKEHLYISSCAGASTAGICASMKGQSTFNIALSVIGGSLGGALTASLPDWIDLPTSSNHRSIAHGVIPNALILPETGKGLFDLSTYLDNIANDFEKKNSLADVVVAIICRLGSGFSVGMLAGYIAHLAADARSPKGLPLLT